MSAYDDFDLPRTATRDRDDARTARLLDGLALDAAQPRHVMVYGDDDLVSLDEALATPPPAQAPLRRYLAYQARDFVKQRGVWIALLAMAGVYGFWYNYDPAEVAARFAEAQRAGGSMEVAGGRDEPSAFRGMAAAIGLLVAAAGSVLATHGIVSQERERGQQRFLFAKPIPLVPYYLQKLGVALAGTLGVVAATMLVMGLVFQRAVPIDAALGFGAMLALVLGSLTFLLSTLVRFEGALAFALTFAVAPVTAIARDPDWRWVAPFRYVLPPIEAILRQWADPTATPFGLVWIAAYVAACVAGGIAVLRRRSILT